MYIKYMGIHYLCTSLSIYQLVFNTTMGMKRNCIAHPLIVGRNLTWYRHSGKQFDRIFFVCSLAGTGIFFFFNSGP
jgi:hypothetical protein